jgi:hypothetical protein
MRSAATGWGRGGRAVQGMGSGGGGWNLIMIAGSSRASPVDALGASSEATDGRDNQLPTSVVKG